jgi:hypothetical protein
MLRFKYKYSSESIDSMMPWERDIELSMIVETLKSELKAKQQQLG